jgi:hypothetical protein
MEIISLLADIVRLVAGVYLLHTATFSTKVKDAGVRFGVGLLLLASVGGA